MASTSTRNRKSKGPKKGARTSPAPRKRVSKKEVSAKSKNEVSGKPEISRDQPKYLKELKISSDRKKPKIVRQESWRYVRVKARWRKPKGIDSKMRVSMKGWPKSHTVGYGSRSIIRGIHPSGYRDVLISNTKELESLSPDKDAGRIRATVGARKRGVIINRARELGVKILNPTGRRHIGSKVEA